MAKMISFTRYENDVLRDFRNRIKKAESSEDVKKFFDYSMRRLFEKVFDGSIDIGPEDCSLNARTDELFQISHRLLMSDIFSRVWENSDLPQIVDRFAGAANKRYIHLEKHNEKTTRKIRQVQ